MAFCSNCGTKIPDGVSFCPACGTRVETAAPVAFGEVPTTPARPAKSKLPLILTVAGLGVVALVLVILLLTGVLGAKGPVGVWELNQPLNSDGDTYVVVLEKGGKGYLKSIIYYPSYNETDYYYYPIQWNDNSVRIMNTMYKGDMYFYTRDGDSLTCQYDGDLLMFHRTSKSTPSSKKLATGTYQITAAYQGTRNLISQYFGSTLVVNSGGSGTASFDSELIPLTWDEHFFYDVEDGDPIFYEFDGKTLVLVNGEIRLEYSRG